MFKFNEVGGIYVLLRKLSLVGAWFLRMKIESVQVLDKRQKKRF